MVSVAIQRNRQKSTRTLAHNAVRRYSTSALYDPSDLTSLYQSRTGGATGAADAVVGIMLDKSQMGGKTAAAFIAGQSNIWSDAAASVAGESQIISPGVFRIYSSVGANSYVANTSRLTVGSWYEVRFTIDSIAVAGAGVRIGDVGEIFTTTGAKTSIFRADLTTAFIKRNHAAAATDYQISNVQFRELPGYHALAPSDAARPILRAGYVDCDGTDDWMQIFPTLNLGEQWWHVGGWQSDTDGRGPFATSSGTGGSVRDSSDLWKWADTGGTRQTIATGNPIAAHVLTIEQAATGGPLTGRFNGGGGGSITPFDDSGSAQGLALFSSANNAWRDGLDGRFYGGAFGTGTLSSADRALLERYVAGLTGVTL